MQLVTARPALDVDVRRGQLAAGDPAGFLRGDAPGVLATVLVGDGYSGSTMLTIDLARTHERISDPADASTAQRVALLYAGDERCREHARRIAIKEARRIAGCELSVPHVDVESRARGPELHLSLNVEAQRERRAAGPSRPDRTHR